MSTADYSITFDHPLMGTNQWVLGNGTIGVDQSPRRGFTVTYTYPGGHFFVVPDRNRHAPARDPLLTEVWAD